MMKRQVFLRTLGILAAVGSPLIAQHAAEPPAPQAYGVDAVTIQNVSVWDAQPVDSLTTWFSLPLLGHRYLLSSGTLFASAHLPEGARIVSFELEACDTSGPGVALAALVADAASNTILATVTTGATPGCGRFAASSVMAHTVNNTDNQYLVAFSNESFDGSTSIGSARIGYQLQVSPPPGAATFGDVLVADPAFQFIEALAASGITAGCGGGNYCPDAPLTRRQMAVFLAKAMGLHWPN
jgi:hypothetical protein